MKKLRIFETINGEPVKYSRSSFGVKLDKEIPAKIKNKEGTFNFVRYSPVFKSFSTSIGGLDCNIKNITFDNEQDKMDLEKMLSEIRFDELMEKNK